MDNFRTPDMVINRSVRESVQRGYSCTLSIDRGFRAYPSFDKLFP
jgi:hypothetical protein